jgi:pimeloyl-ACP methyl ester carboxylesterase
LAVGGFILVAAILVALAGVGAGLTYYVTTTNNLEEAVTPQSYLLNNYISLSFTDRAGGEHEGWLLLGLRSAPVIILCHGYDSNRSDLLSLGTILREIHFNVYLFNFHGPKAKENRSDLGSRQASDLIAAIEAVTRQPDVNPNRVGLFGTSVGAYAALVAAERNPKVKALVVDTTYATPERMFDTEIDRLLGGSSGLFHVLTEAEFHLATWGAESYAMGPNLAKLADLPKLFISGRDNPPLAAMTEELYAQAPQPKQLLVLEHSESGLASEAEKKEYVNQVLNFFLQKLSLRTN